MRNRLLLLLVVVVAIAGGSLVVWAQAKPVLEGHKPYVPTRLDWLEVHLNSKYRVPMSVGKQYSILFTTVHDRNDTIVISADYFPNADREMMNREIDAMRKIVQIVAKGKGWDGWLKVNKKVQVLGQKE